MTAPTSTRIPGPDMQGEQTRGEGTPPRQDQRFVAARLANRLQMHLEATASAMGGTVLAGATVVWTLWNDFRHPLAAAVWFAALGAALTWRLWVRAHHLKRTIAGTAPSPERALLRFRTAFALHGLIWGTLPGLLLHPLPAADQVALVWMVAAMVGASLIVNAFDLLASACFCLPAALPIAGFLIFADNDAFPGLSAIAALFVVMMAQTGNRLSRTTDAAVRTRMLAEERSEQSLRMAEAADQARRELGDQHALLQQVLHTTQQGFCMLDAQGTVLDVNGAMCRLLGLPEEAVRTQRLLDLVSGTAREPLARVLEQGRVGRAGRCEIDLPRSDGSHTPCLALITPILDDDGRLGGLFGLWTDLSGVQMRERERLNSAWALNSMAEAVAVIDADGRCLLNNDAWVRTLGDAGNGRPLPEGTFRTAVDNCLGQRREQTLQLAIAAPDGQTLTLDLRCRPFHDPVHGRPCVVVTLRDITAQAGAQAAVAASAEHLKRTLNAIGDGIFASDAQSPTQPVRFVNDQLLRLWNIPLERAATLSPAQILEASLPLMLEPQRELERIQEIVAGNLADQSLLRLKDGRVLARRCEPALSLARPLRVWTFRDVTTQERALALLQQRDAEQQALLDAFPGFIARFDDALRLSYANPGLAAQLGSTPEALQGSPAAELEARGFAMPTAAELTQVRSGTPLVCELRLGLGESACHTQMTFAAGTEPLSGAPAILAFGVDIGERRRAEAALSAARDDAERANRAKSRFLSQLSHELRTPMHAIDGFSQLLIADPRSPLTTQQRDWAGQIQQGTAHLTALLNDLLDLGRAEAGHLAIERHPVVLHGLLVECRELTASLAARQSLEGPLLVPGEDAAADPTLSVLADRMRLKQVILNLLSNAIKYNRPGGRVEMGTRAIGHDIEIAVRDTGAGLGPLDQARLFTPFERLEAERQGIAGTGIGLALSRQLVEAMGGSIGVRSTLGQGSEFWVRLPAAHAAAQSDVRAPKMPATAPLRTSDPGSKASPRQRELLLVDAQALDQTLMEMLVEEVPGGVLRCATRPDEGLMLAWTRRPDLVLLDLDLPGMDGLEWIRHLRADPRGIDIPVIALGPDTAGSTPAELAAAGFADQLAQPLDAAHVLAVLLSDPPRRKPALPPPQRLTHPA